MTKLTVNLTWLKGTLQGRSVCEIFNCQRCDVHVQGDIALNINMYPVPAVYRRIFNELIQILHCLVDSDLF